MRIINVSEIGERINALRIKMGATALIEATGISRQALYRLSKGLVPNPGIKTLAAIAHAGGVSLEYLLMDTNAHKAEQGITFTEEYLKKRGIAAPLLYTITDDTMYPTYKRGDQVLVNTDMKETEGLNLVKIDGRKFVRRVEHSGSKLHLISDNAQYSNQTLNQNKVDIIGQIVLSIAE